MKMRILVTPKFKKQLKKLPKHIQNLVVKKETIFRNDSFDPNLRSHKLHGKFEGFWAFSVNYNYRVVFEFIEKDVVYFYEIGNHNIYE